MKTFKIVSSCNSEKLERDINFYLNKGYALNGALEIIPTMDGKILYVQSLYK